MNKNSILLLVILFYISPCLKHSQNHYYQVRELLHQQASNIDQTKNINITNMGAKNWIYGDLSTPQYQKIRFGIITTNNVTNCPLNTPFVFKDTTICQQCPLQNPIFNLQTQLCQPCEDDKVFQFRTQLCVDKVEKVKPKIQNTTEIQPVLDVTSFRNITNIGAKNWILGDISFTDYQLLRFSIVQKYNATNCPLETPFVLDGSKDCSPCPEEKPIFVLSNDTCIPCSLDYIFNKTTGKCHPINCSDGLAENTQAIYYDKFDQCQKNEYYDYSQQKCKECEQGKYFDEQWLSCIYCGEDQPYLNEDLQCEACPEDTEIDRIKNQCV